MDWKKDLNTAPRETPRDVVIMAILEGDDHPSFVRWTPYEKGEDVPEDGYWDFYENLVSDVTGGVSPDQAASAIWCEMDISPALALRSDDPSRDI